MAEFKPYVAVTEFTVNVNNGDREIRAKYGDVIEFDGLNVRHKDLEGQARSFSKVIRDGEWVKAISPEKVKVLKDRLAGKKVSAPPQEGPVKARNETAGKIVENSDVGSTRVNNQDQSNNDVQKLINDYEAESFPDAHDDPNKRNIRNTEVEQNVPERQVKVINEDATIVGEVSKEASTDAETKNTAGVEIEDLTEEKPTVISEEESVVKPTNYSGKKEDANIEKKLQVDTESEGKVVRKTSAPATNKTEVNENTKVDEDSKLEVSKEEDVVKETSYEESGSVDVGSSTKAGIVKSASKKSKPKAKKSGANSARPKKVASGDPQGGEVVGKVRKHQDPVESVDGISVKTTIGKNEEEPPEVEFSSGGDGIENSEATFSKSGESAVDIAGSEEFTEVSADTSSDIDLGDDIDISDLLE